MNCIQKTWKSRGQLLGVGAVREPTLLRIEAIFLLRTSGIQLSIDEALAWKYLQLSATHLRGVDDMILQPLLKIR